MSAQRGSQRLHRPAASTGRPGVHVDQARPPSPSDSTGNRSAAPIALAIVDLPLPGAPDTTTRVKVSGP